MTSPARLFAFITNAQDTGTDTPGVGSVIPVDLASGEPQEPIELGNGAGTNAIIVTSDGSTAFVTNEFTNSPHGSVSRIDLATGAVRGSIPVGREPVDIEFVPGTGERWAWVANYKDNTITTVNLARGTVGSTIKVPYAGPNTVAFLPDGSMCYVANWGTGDEPGSTVTMIEVMDGGASGFVAKSFLVGSNPNWIAFTKDGATAYIVNKGSNSITPFDVATNATGAAILLNGPPIQMEIAPDGTFAYIAIAGQTIDNQSIDFVVPMDLTVTPGKVGPAIALASGTQPHWIAFTPDGATAYVVGNGNSTLTPITVATGAIGTPIQVSKDPVADILDIAIVAFT